MLERQTSVIGRTGSYRPDVDGLRALAVLAVMLFHYDIHVLSGGFTGVDIFFVISGFVITNSIYHDLQTGQFSIARFYFKRVKRLMPALSVVYLASALAATVIFLPNDLVSFGQSLMASVGFVSNIYFWKTTGYFAASADTQPLLHTWSLSIEEQYYLFAPVFFLVTYRLGVSSKYVAGLLITGAVITFGLAVAAVFVAPSAGYLLLPTRLWELLFGAIVALTPVPQRNRNWDTLKAFLSYLGFLLIVAGIFGLTSDDPFPGWNALLPCLGTALIIYGGTGGNGTLVSTVLSNRIISGIGLISYSLYLIHWPLVAFIRYQINRELVTYEAVGLAAIAMVLAYVSWRFVEQPFRKFSYSAAPKAFLGAACSAVVLLGFAGSIVFSEGYPQRFPDFKQTKITGVEAWGGNACFHQNASYLEKWNPEHCLRVTGSRGNILVWGDSFAAHYMPGILSNSASINANVYQYTFAGCPPILAYFSLARRACSQFNEQALSVMDEQKIDLVVISARWSEVKANMIGKLGDTIKAIKDKGIAVAVIGPSPEFPAEVQRLDYMLGNSKLSSEVKAEMVPAKDLEEAVRSAAVGAKFVDPLTFLCSGQQCTYRNGSAYYYADYGHLSGFGANLAVKAYFPTVDVAK